jgi:hypothetical protein
LPLAETFLILVTVMVSFTTPSKLEEFIGITLDAEGSPEVSTEVITDRIDESALDIAVIVQKQFRNKFPVPNVEPNPTTNTWLILELLNVLDVAFKVVRVKTGDVSKALIKQAKTVKRMRDFIWVPFEQRVFDRAWLKGPLDTDPFANVSDLEIDTAGFTADTNIDNGATIEVLERLVSLYTAVVRARARRKNYNQDLSSISSNQLAVYKAQVSLPIRAYVVLARTRAKGEYTEEIDKVINEWLSEAEEKWNEFDKGNFNPIFIS